MDTDLGSSPRKLVECKICHDEDEASYMEVPCSCSGSLKYAHRRCVQRWCNEKGDTICEICRQLHFPLNVGLQSFKPGYIAPSPLSRYGGISRNLRDLHNNEFVAMVYMDGSFLDPDFDEYPTPSSRSLICCRIVAIIFIVLLVLRQTLPVIISSTEEYSPTLFMLVVLRIIGILLPVYIMVKAFTAVQRCRHQQVSRNSTLLTSNEENELPLRHPSQHLTHLW